MVNQKVSVVNVFDLLYVGVLNDVHGWNRILTLGREKPESLKAKNNGFYF